MYFDSRLWQFTEGVRGRILAAVAVGLAAATCGIARLAMLGWLLGMLFRGAAMDELIWPFALVAVVMAARGLLEYWRNMIAHRTAATVQLGIRGQLYDKIVELGPAHFGLERTGDVIVALIDGVEQLETYFGQYLPQLAVSVLTPIGIFAFVAFLDLPVAAVLSAFALFTLIAPAAFHQMDREGSMRRARAYADFGAEFLDSVQGLATLKAFGQSRARGRLLAEKAHELFRSTMWVLATNSLGRGITDTGIAVGVAATIGLGAYRVTSGAMAIEALLIILMMGIEVYRPLRDLRALLHQGMLGQAAAQSVFAILDAVPVITTGDAAAAPALTASIEFDNVAFSYPGGRQPAHRGLSFAIAAGERVGIVGPSGAGKSSILRLLLRLYDPQSGVVRLGGRDLRALALADIRAQFAIVSQDTYLFHGTVEDNLRFGKPGATTAELEAATRAANAHDFIRTLPQGYGTVVGERGVRLSGGQRQRIAIARALLRDAPILVLDEALSAVDAENEAVIQQALDRLMQGRTTLIFAHRLSSVIDADRILVLDDGAIAEEGRHAALMARGGAYHQLMAAQAQDSAGGDVEIGGAARPALDPVDLPDHTEAAQWEPTDAILRAEGMGWAQAFGQLMRLVLPWKGRLTMTFIFGVLRVVALIGVGVFSALAILALKQDAPFSPYLWALAVVAPAAGILHWMESWVAHDMAFRLLAEMRVDLFNKLDKLAPAYLLRRRTGDLVGMATQDVETVEYFFAHTVAPAFVAALVPGVVLVTLLAYGWQMAAALLPFLVLVGLSPFLARHRIDALGSRAREALGELNAFAVDSVQGLLELIAFQRERDRAVGLRDRVRAYHKIRLPFFADLAAQTALLEFATGMGGLAVVVSGAHLIQTGALAPGLLPLLTLLAMAAFLPISEIASIGRQLADTLGATRRLYAVHNEEIVVSDGPGAPPRGEAGGATMALEGASFAYNVANRPAIVDVALDFPAGATVALVGPSGAGKTTLAHLLMRFWDPDQGRVSMDGHDLKDYPLDDLRRNIALVAQDTYLFNTTLEANIRIARPEASDAEVADAVARAALDEFVATLPDGLETRVGERGVRLSGGQRQRVAIARAFLKDAPVLILDEATSHLDAVNEQLVRKALEDLKSDRTTIVIAHRLSTVRNADLIVVLDRGRVVETGAHGELLARGGPYAHLVARQLGASAGVVSAAGD